MKTGRRTALKILGALPAALLVRPAAAEKAAWDERAFAQAQQQNRAILVDIYADW